MAFSFLLSISLSYLFLWYLSGHNCSQTYFSLLCGGDSFFTWRPGLGSFSHQQQLGDHYFRMGVRMNINFVCILDVVTCRERKPIDLSAVSACCACSWDAGSKLISELNRSAIHAECRSWATVFPFRLVMHLPNAQECFIMVNFEIVIPKSRVLSSFSVCGHSLRVTCNLCWNIYVCNQITILFPVKWKYLQN